MTQRPAIRTCQRPLLYGRGGALMNTAELDRRGKSARGLGSVRRSRTGLGVGRRPRIKSVALVARARTRRISSRFRHLLSYTGDRPRLTSRTVGKLGFAPKSSSRRQLWLPSVPRLLPPDPANLPAQAASVRVQRVPLGTAGTVYDTECGALPGLRSRIHVVLVSTARPRSVSYDSSEINVNKRSDTAKLQTDG